MPPSSLRNRLAGLLRSVASLIVTAEPTRHETAAAHIRLFAETLNDIYALPEVPDA